MHCLASESIVKIYRGRIPRLLCIFTFCHIPRARKLRTALVPAQHAIARSHQKIGNDQAMRKPRHQKTAFPTKYKRFMRRERSNIFSDLQTWKHADTYCRLTATTRMQEPYAWVGPFRWRKSKATQADHADGLPRYRCRRLSQLSGNSCLLRNISLTPGVSMDLAMNPLWLPRLACRCPG